LKQSTILRNSILLIVGIVMVLIVTQFTSIGKLDPKQAHIQVQAILGRLLTSFGTFRKDCGRMPPLESWKSEMTAQGNCRNWKGPYVQEKQTIDPWGREVLYREKGNSYQIGTYGEDGEPGGEDAAEDVFLSVP
jgi:general secretion pathway protein G